MYTYYMHTHTPKPIHTYYDIRALAALARVVCARVHPQKKCRQTAGCRQCHPPSLKVHTQQGVQYTIHSHTDSTATHTQRGMHTAQLYIHTERHTDSTHSYTCTAHTATHRETHTTQLHTNCYTLLFYNSIHSSSIQ